MRMNPARRAGAAIALMVVVVVVGAVAGCTPTHPDGASSSPSGSGSGSGSGPVLSAAVYRDQAAQLVIEIAAVVAPGDPVTKIDTGDSGATNCERPLQKLYYYSMGRQFDAPAGQTGGSLIPAIITQLQAHGFQTAAPQEMSGWPGVRAGNQAIDLSVQGDPTGRTVRFSIASQCGTLPPRIDDTTAPSVTPTITPSPSV
jgi:hypothetical protein